MVFHDYDEAASVQGRDRNNRALIIRNQISRSTLWRLAGIIGYPIC